MTSPITGLYPEIIRKKLEDNIKYSTIETPPDKFLRNMFLISLFASLIISLFINYLNVLPAPYYILISIFAIFVISHIAFYAWLVLSIEAKGNFVDFILPDALRLVSSNLRSGATIDQALVQSARVEFGPLKDAIENAGKKIATGDDEVTAFRSMLDAIKSNNLRHAINLIAEGIHSGGQLSGILDKIADVFRDRSLLSREIRSNVMIYAIFIFIVLGVGAPALFGISDFLVNVAMSGMASAIPEIEGDVIVVGGAFSPTELYKGVTLTPGFMLMFFLLALTVSSITGSIVIGQILNGSEKSGLKYIPILLALSLTVLFVIRFVLQLTLGELIA